MNLLSNFLTQGTPVTICANVQKDNILVTPMVDKTTGEVKTDLNGNILASIMLEQLCPVLNGTFFNEQRRVAFVAGRLDVLEAKVKNYKITAGSTLPGKIVIYESLEPFFEGQSAKVNPNTKEPIGFTIKGTFYPVYYQTHYKEDATVPDVLIRSVEAAEAWINARRILVNTPQDNGMIEKAHVPN